MPSPDRRAATRMSRGIKLVLMGVAGAALLYSCTPGHRRGPGRRCPTCGSCRNPFYRRPSRCCRRVAACDADESRSGSSGSSSGYGSGRSTTSTAFAVATSQRGGFGEHGQLGRLVGLELKHAPRSRRRRVPAGRASSSSSASTTTSWTARPTGPSRPATPSPSDEIDQLEAATEELHGLCLKAVEHVVVEQALGAHAHPAGLGRLHRDGVAALRSDDLRPLRSRL